MFSLFRLFIACSALGSLLTILPAFSWWLELNRNFGAYYLFAHLGALVVIPLAWRWSSYRRLVWGAVIACLAVHQALPVVPFFESDTKQTPCKDAASFKVFYANVQQDAPDRASTKAQLAAGDFDLIGLVETDSHWLEELTKYTSNFNHKIERPRDDKFGLAIYSKYPFKEVRPADFFGDSASALSAQISVPKIGEVEVVLMHAAPPLSKDAFASNKLLFRRVSTFVRHVSGPTIVMGDFNATPHSNFYARMVEGAELEHVFWGRGFPRTWNAYTWGERFMLDHVLTKGGFEVSNLSIAPVSDHFSYSAALNYNQCR